MNIKLALRFCAVLIIASTSTAMALPTRDLVVDVGTSPTRQDGGPATVWIAGGDPITEPWSVSSKTTPIAGLSASDFGTITSPFGIKPNAGGLPIPRGQAQNCTHGADITVNTYLACESEIAGLIDGYYKSVFLFGLHIQGIDNRVQAINAQLSPLTTKTAYTAYSALVDACIFSVSPNANCSITNKAEAPQATDLAGALQNQPYNGGPVSASFVDVQNEYVSLQSGPGFASHQLITKQLALLTTFAGSADGASHKAAVTQNQTDLKTAETALSTDSTAYGKIAGLQKSGFYTAHGPFTCSGLFNGGASDDITITATNSTTTKSRTIDETVICNPSLFLSQGFAADGIDNRTYQNIPANTAGLPAPAPSATPMPGIIAASNTGARMGTAAFINWAAFPIGYDGSSVGLSIGALTPFNAGGGFKADILAGLSLTINRTVVITGGQAFGTATKLAPGYTLNGPIPSATTPPTTSGAASGWFVGISYNFTQPASSNKSTGTAPVTGSQK